MGILKVYLRWGNRLSPRRKNPLKKPQGVRMLEQHIRDAKAELDKAGKSRVDLAGAGEIKSR